MLHQLVPLVEKHKRRGRGHAKRGGKSGRGMKGQKSRAGYHRKRGFEGGQTPLYMRLPKARGSKQKFPSQVVKPEAVSVAQLNAFRAGETVGPEQLASKGLIRWAKSSVKLIGSAEVKTKLTVRVHAATQAATRQIEAAGGTVTVLT